MAVDQTMGGVGHESGIHTTTLLYQPGGSPLDPVTSIMHADATMTEAFLTSRTKMSIYLTGGLLLLLLLPLVFMATSVALDQSSGTLKKCSFVMMPPGIKALFPSRCACLKCIEGLTMLQLELPCTDAG